MPGIGDIIGGFGEGLTKGREATGEKGNLVSRWKKLFARKAGQDVGADAGANDIGSDAEIRSARKGGRAARTERIKVHAGEVIVPTDMAAEIHTRLKTRVKPRKAGRKSGRR